MSDASGVSEPSEISGVSCTSSAPEVQARHAFVLAGGQSSRMGRDKAQLPFQGKTLLEHALEKLRNLGFTAAVAGLRETTAWNASFVSASVISDAYKESGPLGGIEAALHSLEREQPQPVLFVPVDLPLLPAHFLKLLWERAQRSGCWATVPFFAGKPQPLCAVYDSRLAAGITEALAGGDRKVVRVLRQLAPRQRFDAFRVEALAPLQGFDGSWNAPHHWFRNMNSPADWQALLETTSEKLPSMV